MARWLGYVLILLAFVPTASAQQKKRVAVLDFDYSTVRDSASAIVGTDVDVGKGVADLLVQDLVKAGLYSVIERKAIDKVLAEQNFSNSDRADPAAAAKLGKVLGVDAIIMGSITKFGTDNKVTNANVGSSPLGGIAGKFGMGGASRKQSKAVVGLSARMVSVDTGEILAVGSGQGESKRSGTSLLGAGGSSTASGGALDMTSSNFSETLLGEAVDQAADGLSKELDGNADKIIAKVVVIDGLVADVDGNTLTLNVGTKAGVKVGDKLQVKHASREIKDPATGKVIRRIEDTLGEVTITEADSDSSVGTFAGASLPQTGDRVVSEQ